jgi:LacI family transcriptional regulator
VPARSRTRLPAAATGGGPAMTDDTRATTAGTERARRRRSRPRPGGPRPPTVDDVAALAGVSTATVSRVLTDRGNARPETRRRVMEAAASLGYRPSGPARALQGHATGMLGLIMTDIAQPFYTELARVVESEARRHGYTIMLANGAADNDREAAYLDLLAERRVDGILVASWGITTRHLEWLVRAPVPVVLVSCEAPGVALPAIVAASRDGARQAAEHLVGLGHRRLAEIVGPPLSAAAADRHAGVLDALDAAGIPADELAVAACGGDAATGEAAAAELVARRPRPTAIVCYNDLVALGAMRAVRAAGLRLPEDVSVVGFDDIALAELVHPGLTTVAQPGAEMATWAVGRLVEQIAATRGGRSLPVPDVLRMPCRLVVRGSTAAPAGLDETGPGSTM